MVNQPSAPLDDREWTKQDELLHAILWYLTERGPTSWIALYLYFDPHGTGEIGSALKHLTTVKYIVVDTTIVTVTVSGMAQLTAEWRPSVETVCQSS
jgi:hypothetical protein